MHFELKNVKNNSKQLPSRKWEFEVLGNRKLIAESPSLHLKHTGVNELGKNNSWNQNSLGLNLVQSSLFQNII